MKDRETKDRETDEQATDLELEVELDAPPQKVWRAISMPAFRDRWLPEADLSDAEPVSSEEGREVRYGMKDDAPPFLESVVTFQIRPNGAGGTILRIVHELADERLQQQPQAANTNRPVLMRAA